MSIDLTASSATVNAGALDSIKMESFNSGDGALSIIDNLMMRLQKMNLDMRDLERSFFTSQQSVAFERQVHALGMKREAIEKNFESSTTAAIGQIAAGGIGFVGAVTGAIGEASKAGGSGPIVTLESRSISASSNRMKLSADSFTVKVATESAKSSSLEHVAKALMGGKDAAQGIANYSAAVSKREAEHLQLDADFETQATESFLRSLEKTMDHAIEASRQLRESTRELVALNDRLCSAVRF
ncbi:MAG: secreted effector protein SseD [Glomeribacter sp. 1016415]|nr:secreted effector protein SseD [Glomeribacter sp. 1016415]